MPAPSRAEEQQIRKPGTHHQQVYETMKARVDASYPDNVTLVRAYHGAAQYGLRSMDRFVVVASEVK